LTARRPTQSTDANAGGRSGTRFPPPFYFPVRTRTAMNRGLFPRTQTYFETRRETTHIRFALNALLQERALRPISDTSASTVAGLACHQLVKSRTASLEERFVASPDSDS